MDPKACIIRILNAIHAEDWEDLEAACKDLEYWRMRGGYMPSVYEAVKEWKEAND